MTMTMPCKSSKHLEPFCSLLLSPAASPPDPNSPEVSTDGWNARDGEYAFLYSLEDAAPGGTLLLRCLTVNDALLVTFLATNAPGKKGASAQVPETLELSLQHYLAPEGADAAAALSPGQYGHLQELVDLVQAAIESQVRGQRCLT